MQKLAGLEFLAYALLNCKAQNKGQNKTLK